MTDENILDQAIAKIDDETLRLRIAREVELLRGSRRFGLVFDRHLPESVRLPDHPIRKGVRVALRDESTDETWRVTGFTDRTRTVAVLSEDGGDVHTSDLVVVREFGEPVFPGLQSVERIANGPGDAPWHTVINGENYHVLQALRSTHRGKVDLIYIDPPYNTGNEGWIYNDRYVADQDRAKSSKWLSFMERRLLTARDLLKPTGVIIVAIGDDEHHRLRMLLDQVFGDSNFIGNVAWQGGVSALSKHHGGGLDYMLIYGRDANLVGPFRDPKPMAPEMLQLVADAMRDGASGSQAQEQLRTWIKKEGKDLPPGVRRFNKVDDAGNIYLEGDLANSLPRPNLRYPITDPASGRVVQPPANGWAVGKELMTELIEKNRIIFHKGIPTRKRLLSEQMDSLPTPSFYRDRRTATNRLRDILGDRRFPFPKDHEVVMRWIRMATPKDGVILDFFAGSGTTAEAVMRLNAEDGGTRSSLCVTNNEVGAKQARTLRASGHHPGDPEWESKGVFEYVARPRVATVATGVRSDGSSYSEPLEANVEFFKMTYLDPGTVRRGREFEAIAPLLWLEAGATGERIDVEPESGWALTTEYGILFTVEAMAPFTQAVADAAKNETAPQVVFIITDSPTEFQAAAERLPAGIDTVRLYESYLANYTINTGGSAR